MVRTSIVFGLVAAGLLAYILVVDEGTLSTRELEQREHSVLPEFIRDKVSRIEVERDGVTTVLSRELGSMDEAGLWHVEQPYAALADKDAVDTLIGELEWMDARRRLQGVTEADRRSFGFDEPRYRVFFTVGKERIEVLVGRQDPKGEGFYVRGRDPQKAFVVGKDLTEALDHAPEHYHTREVHDGVLVATTTAVRLRDDAGERAVERREDDLWELTDGGRGLASGPAVSELINAVDALRARRFVEQDAADLTGYGLQPPQREVIIERTRLSDTEKDEQGKPKRVPGELRVRVGAPCEGHDAERYLTVDDAGTVFCAADADLDKLTKSADELREARLLPLADGEVDGVALAADERSLTLTRGDEGWAFELREGDSTLLEGPAREGSVDDFLQSLRAQTAQRFDAELPGAAAITARFERPGETPAFLLRAAAATGETRIQRADESFGVAFAPDSLTLLTPTAAPFRPLAVLSRDAGDLRSLHVRRGGSREVLSRDDDGKWTLEAPVQAAADAVTLSELSRLLGGLEAARFVTDRPAPEHGLQDPEAVVELGFGDDAPVTLRVGAETEGGRFAELSTTPGVFVISQRLWQQLAGPLVDRTALGTPVERLERVQRTVGRDSVTVEASEQGEPAPLLRAVATLRASAVAGYGAPAASLGFARPHASLEVTTEEGTYTLQLGAPAEGGGRYA
ncbi:MAG: DUF4340 domain-containing protein, partial [Myxococcales bacterium]